MRKRRSTADWSDLIERQAASGLSVKDWCAQENINLQTMYKRQSQVRRQHLPVKAKKEVAFAPVVIASTQDESMAKQGDYRLALLSLPADTKIETLSCLIAEFAHA